MKSFSNLSILIGLLFTSYGCGLGKWDVGEQYIQKIEGTSKLLYKYDAWGGRDSHCAGYVILDSSETFKVDPKENLPFYYLMGIPNKTVIEGVSHICDNSCGEVYKKAISNFIPLKKEASERQGIHVINIVYQYKGFAERGGGIERYHFENFKETRDSLFFYNLDDVESRNGQHVDSLQFRKTDVTIMQNETNDINKIIIQDLVVDRAAYEIKSNITYYLTPKSKVRSNSFSDYGIFKEVAK
ncbi:hypothetical protein C3K47_05410 [Solitalea longa]|uniref:Lipoprotein n=1 Tax=Solitalea longa TaxID=2079460 RepID=A0A2S5A6J2_9SPHI|nr:hypothetical protein [Solitalea longa]POY37962.1 hypothetical protein C3K47_05410 [Solitalea longa]